jgi:excisionase family DNA binding protein
MSRRKENGTIGTAEAARELGVSVHRVRQLIKSGRLLAVLSEYPRGKAWRIAPGDLEAVRVRPTGRPKRKAKT